MNNKGCGCIHKFICEKDLRTERLDPYFYQIELELKKKLENKQTVPLRMLCKEITDGTRNATEFVGYRTTVPYIRLSNIVDNKLVQKGMKYLFDLDGIEEKAIVRKGDILISKIVSLPKITLVDEAYDGAVISPDIIKIRPVDQQAQAILMKFFASNIGMLSLKKMAVPSVLPKISLKQLEDLAIVIDVDSEEEGHNQQAILKQQLHNLYGFELNELNASLPTEFWVQKQLSTKRLDVDYYRYHTSKTFEQLKNKIKTERWVQLKDVCEIVRQTVSPADFNNKKIRYIGFKNIDTNSYRIISAETISFEKVRSRARYVLKENDILLGVVGPYIGEENQPLAFVTREYEGALASSAFVVLRNCKYSSAYLLWCLSHPLVRFQLRAKRRGQLQMMISIDDLERIYLPAESPEKINLIENMVKKLVN
ncbi:restriction endonuclease subunit S [Geobacillus sp. NFOSA3]|uniref:Type I restriction modification DNA specificity domain-containing protein n=1 Tax=Parageobacillus galactosidasius TaxID=883812 RepID=A0A226QTR4_9BACL|nr:restriction endonuclease subunit S [Parageobacillus galactosidasius]NNU92822.1 restriction endonuclease subunit S [Geobacillus sp. NFOSA3]OXB94970.1 hypothetical protein B9L23_09020 [Parageobacillus galactosidasius]